MARDALRQSHVWITLNDHSSASRQQLVRLLEDNGRFQTEDGKVVTHGGQIIRRPNVGQVLGVR